MKYIVNRTPTEKITITISRKQLWLNFVEFWGKFSWKVKSDQAKIDDIALLTIFRNSLVSNEPLNEQSAARLFDGHVLFLLPQDALDLIKTNDCLIEIVVTDENNPNVIVSHKNIK
jgi:hypothetical protein